jgi:putative endonuclease
MGWLKFVSGWFPAKASKAAHLRTGARGERLACQFLKKRGMRWLYSGYLSRHGEIDLVFREQQVLVFVEVKTRVGESWQRPAAAVDRVKQARIRRTASDYLGELASPPQHYRFDIVEVVLHPDHSVQAMRHLPGAFSLLTNLKPVNTRDTTA